MNSAQKLVLVFPLRRGRGKEEEEGERGGGGGKEEEEGAQDI